MKKPDLSPFNHGFKGEKPHITGERTKGDKPSTLGERTKGDKPYTMGERTKNDKPYTLGEKPYAEEVRKDPVWDRLISEQGFIHIMHSKVKTMFDCWPTSDFIWCPVFDAQR